MSTRTPLARRVIAALTLTVLAACASAQTQTGLSLGDRVRITPSDPAVERLVGSYADRRADGLVVVGEGDTITIPTSGIATLERQEGTRGRGGVGSIIGLFGVGAIGVVVAQDCATGSSDDLEDVCKVFVIGAGAIGGALLGAIVGSFIRTENWVVVPLIEVAPTGQGTSASEFGFGLHARVGLPW